MVPLVQGDGTRRGFRHDTSGACVIIGHDVQQAVPVQNKPITFLIPVEGTGRQPCTVGKDSLEAKADVRVGVGDVRLERCWAYPCGKGV